MGTISRRLPQSKKTRNQALRQAKDKKDSNPPSGNILTAATTTRLDAIEPAYKAAMEEVAQKEFGLKIQTGIKNLAYVLLQKNTRVFIKSFNNGIELGNYNANGLVAYQLPTGGTLPKFTSEQELLEVGAKLIAGDAVRASAGGAAMMLPNIADYTTIYDDFKIQLAIQSNKKDELDTAQEVVDALNDEADAVIKKVWDEVETYYNEEVKESQRANAREWGVVYITTGIKPSIISGTMLNAVTNLPLPQSANPEVYMEGPDLTASVNADGSYSIETTYLGTSNITGLGIGFDDNVKTVNVVEDSANDVGFIMTPV